MRTNELRKQIEAELRSVLSCPVYYRIADNEAVFPHCVWFLDNVSSGSDDFNRFIYALSIDIFDRGYSNFNIEEWTDQLAKRFNFLNEPTSENLPTFYLQSISSMTEEDKLIQHRHLNIQVVLYER